MPDLWVFSAAATEDKTGLYWDCVPGWYWWGWYPYWDPCAWYVPIPFDFTVGTLAVGLVDSESQKPVFLGVARGVMECGDVQDRIESAVDEMFDDYPSD